MKERLVNYFQKFTALTQQEAQAIEDSILMKTYPKGTILLAAGEICQDCYFILEGCISQYYLIDGVEKISNFFTESQWALSLTSFTQQIPADHYFECMEDTTVVIGNEEKEQELFKQFPNFETLSRSVMEQEFAKHQQMIASYVTESPEQRYLKVLKERPDLIQRIPQYQLASYIGVKPESLSRIRKRLAQNDQ